MLTFESRSFEEPDAALYVNLAASAFAAQPPAARPKDTPAHVAHLHGDANPAGRARVALAHLDGRPVGHVSALPGRFLRRDGVIATGWQIGCFVVDATAQGRGVGKGLIQAISAEVRAPHDFIYTYPNRRSIGVFLKLGYERIGRSATWLAWSTPDIRRRSSVSDQGDRWEVRRVGSAELDELLERTAEPPTQTGGFLRDRDYFRWRTLRSAQAGYRHLLLERKELDEHIAVAVGRHEFKGLTFSILVDAWPDVLERHLALIVRAVSRFGPSPLVYLNTNRTPRLRTAVRVPLRFDPRPVELLVYPSSTVPAELAQAPAITADWMGF